MIIDYLVVMKKKIMIQNKKQLPCDREIIQIQILTHIRPNKPPYYILEESNFNLKYDMLCDLDIRKEKKAKLFINSGDLDQTPLFGGVSRRKWVQ